MRVSRLIVFSHVHFASQLALVVCALAFKIGFGRSIVGFHNFFGRLSVCVHNWISSFPFRLHSCLWSFYFRLHNCLWSNFISLSQFSLVICTFCLVYCLCCRLSVEVCKNVSHFSFGLELTPLLTFIIFASVSEDLL